MSLSLSDLSFSFVLSRPLSLPPSLSLSLPLALYLSIFLVCPWSSLTLHQCVSVTLGFSFCHPGVLSPLSSVGRCLSLSFLPISPPLSVPASVSLLPVRSPEHLGPTRPGFIGVSPGGGAHLVFSESGFCSQTNECGSKRIESTSPRSGAGEGGSSGGASGRVGECAGREGPDRVSKGPAWSSPGPMCSRRLRAF